MKIKILGVLLLLLISASAFWWFEYRPYKARVDCTKEANELFTKMLNDKVEGEVAVLVVNNKYRHCFLKRGLKTSNTDFMEAK